MYEKASVKIKLFFVNNDVFHNSKHKKTAASFTRETSNGLSFVLFASHDISADIIPGSGIGAAGNGDLYVLCATNAHIEHLIGLAVSRDLQRVVRTVAVYTVDVFFQTEVVFLHIESVGYAYIAECICTAVLTGFFVLAVRIAYHKAIFCGMFCDPAVLRILFCIIIVRSAVPEIDFQVEAAAAVIIGIAATESGAAVLIAGILICLVPIAAEHLHADRKSVV